MMQKTTKAKDNSNNPGNQANFSLAGFILDDFVRQILTEDLGGDYTQGGADITSEAVIPKEAEFTGELQCREPILVAGLAIAAAVFSALDPKIKIEFLAQDGQELPSFSPLLRIRGNARALLAAERSALNVLQHLSGVATITKAYVKELVGTGCNLLDTRKTTPGLRVLEKYATRIGGAINHRMGLWDTVMIKDNHIAIAGGIRQAIMLAKAAGHNHIIVEIDRLDQIEEAIAAGASHLLLDNMTQVQLQQAVKITARKVPTEASGGVTLSTIRALALTGVDYISVGRITQSAPAVDIGMDFKIDHPKN